MKYSKLIQGCIFGIILAVSWTVHTTNETSVNLTIHCFVLCGKTTILNCTIDRKFNVCENENYTRRWTKYEHHTLLTVDEYSLDNTKYKETVNKNCTASSLHINNFEPNDFGVYTCSFGFQSKQLELERCSFGSNPITENINIDMSCSNNHLELEMEMQKKFSTTMCYSNIKHFKMKHRIVHTNLTFDQYDTKGNLKAIYELKDHSCSDVIHTFCLFDKTKEEVFNKTFNCCSDTHVSLLLIVPIGCVVIISFAVIGLLVYLFKKKKIGFCRKRELNINRLTEEDVMLLT